jgi:DNA polymerase III alpha subunit
VWKRLDSIVPLEPAAMPDRTIVQWDKDDCEALKIVKIDLLGLGMMAVLRDTITLIREHHGEDMDLYKVPADDPEVYETLQNADTVGMFQVESRAQIAFLPKSKPRNFYDIVVQVAIIRPGPVVGHMLHAYINRGRARGSYVSARITKARIGAHDGRAAFSGAAFENGNGRRWIYRIRSRRVAPCDGF